jgi:hypothetical protein
MRLNFTCLVGLILLSAQVRAVPSGADFLLLEPTARAVGVGGAYTAHRGRPEGLRYNPASLVGIKGAMASMAHVAAPGDWSHEWAGLGLKVGALSLGAEILVSSIQPFELYDSSGKVAAMAQAGSQNLMLALAGPLGRPWLNVGAGIRGFRSQLFIFESQGWAGDLGLLVGEEAWPLNFGLALQNLGVQSAYVSDADPLPLALRGGALGRLDLDQGLRLTPSLDVLSFTDSTRPLELRLGMEAAIYDRIGLRIGLQRAGTYQQLSFGAGLNWKGWGLDYAFLPGNELGASHLIELHVSTGR